MSDTYLMFGRGYPLFRLLGFQVRMDPSWLLLAVLVAWSLASGLFPALAPGLDAATYWFLGVVGVFGLLFSIVMHEFCHSLVARRFGLPIGGISLFLFGGVAEMEDEPPGPLSEFLMAAAGPASSLAASGLFFGFQSVGSDQGWPLALVVLLFYLGYLNLILAIFNLLPAFPLDGGRMLRAVLWGAGGNIQRATRWAAAMGQGFGLGLIAVGFVSAFNGYVLSGLWWVLIGMFLRSAADASYKQVVIRERLHGETVRRFMREVPLITVPADISLRRLFEEYVYKYQHKLYPVVQDDELVGCISTSYLRGLPLHELETRSVAEYSRACDVDTTVSADADAGRALSQMLRTGNSRLVVVDGSRLAGVITLKDLARFLAA